ncbi:hypothetical protein L6R53_06670 [Myxococcota bacterium]|nr:hypothetical protein [Myxococcota bacterium]
MLALSFAWLLACSPSTDDTAGTGPVDDTAGTTPVELSYDDGVAEGNSSPWGSDGTGAVGVHFTAEGPVRLLTARYYIGLQGIPTTPFDVEVSSWDAATNRPGEVVYTTTATPAGGDQWLDVDLSAAEVEVDGDFVVAMVFTTPPGDDGSASLFLGADQTDPDDRSFVRYDDWGTIRMVWGFRAD